MGRRRGILGAALLACVVAAAASAGATGAARGEIPATAPADVRGLPAEGLVVARRHDVLLVGLDGRVRARLAGFRLADRGTGVMGELVGVVMPALPLV